MINYNIMLLIYYKSINQYKITEIHIRFVSAKIILCHNLCHSLNNLFLLLYKKYLKHILVLL